MSLGAAILAPLGEVLSDGENRLFAQARPVSVYASGNQAVNFTDFEYEGERSDILDNALVIVNYANGVRARFDLCMFAPLFYHVIS